MLSQIIPIHYIKELLHHQDNLPSRNPRMLPSRAYQTRPQVIERKDGKVTIVITEQQFRMIQQRKQIHPRQEMPMCKKCSKHHKHS